MRVVYFVAVQAESCCLQLQSWSSGTPDEGRLVERRKTFDAGRERPRGRPAEDCAVVDVSLRRSAAPPDMATLAPPQLNDVGVQHGLAMALQGPVAGKAQCRGACRCVRRVRGVRSHAEETGNTRACPPPANFRVIPGTVRRLS